MIETTMHHCKISRRAFLSVLAAAGLLTACGSAPSSAQPAAEAPTPAEAPVAEPQPEAEPFLKPEEFPVVDGSTACLPLIARILSETTGLPLEDAQSIPTVSTTAYAWERLAVWGDEDCSLLIVYEAPDYVQSEIAEAGTQLEKTPIGRDALVFIVNENNPVKSLTRQQLLDIYAGKITNWKEVGGADCEIVPFQRGEDSGSQALFRKLLIQDNPLMDPPQELAPTEMGGLIDSVAGYNNSANALGFSVYFYVDQMYSQPGLRLLAVDGVLPSNESIGDKSYPLCNEFYAVLRQNAAPNSPERQIYDWLQTDAGRRCIEAAGYVPA